MQDQGEKITPSQNITELTGIDRLSAFETKFQNEVNSIPLDIVAYQHAFGELANAPAVRINIWKLGSQEVHKGGYSAKVWVETRKDVYGRKMDVLVIQDGYNPKVDINQVDTFELTMGTFREHQAVGLKLLHEDIKGGSYELKTLLPSITPDRFNEMVASVRNPLK